MNNIKNITIAFCEGPHDTAFLYRILKTRCFKRFGGTLNMLPKVVGNFIIKNNKMAEYEKLIINRLNNEFVPNVLYKNESLILLYAMEGDKDNNNNNKNKRLIVLKHFFENIKSQVEDNTNYGDTWIEENEKEEAYYYKFLFFYDADKNKDEKIEIANTLLSKINITNTLTHNKIIKQDGYSLGTYIFSDKDNKGALEDVLFELMKKDNETIFNKAEEYYSTYLNKDENMNVLKRTKRLVTECADDDIPRDKRKDKKQEDEKKSIICIAGQLQKKGKSNVVIIEDSDYLNLEKIQTSKQLQEIANLFDK